MAHLSLIQTGNTNKLKALFEPKIINHQKPTPRTNPVQQQSTQSPSIQTKQVERSQGAKDLKTNFDGFQFLIDNAETLGIQGIQLENVKKIQAHIKASKNRAVDEHNPELQKLVIAEFKEAREDFIEYVRSEASFEDLKIEYSGADPRFGILYREYHLIYDEFKDIIAQNDEHLLKTKIIERFTNRFNALYKALESDQNFTTCKSELYYKKLIEYLSPREISKNHNEETNTKQLLDLDHTFLDYGTDSRYNGSKNMKKSDIYQTERKKCYDAGRFLQIHIYSKDPDFPIPVFNYALSKGCTINGITTGRKSADNIMRNAEAFLSHDYAHEGALLRFLIDLILEGKIDEIKAIYDNMSRLFKDVHDYIMSLPQEKRKETFNLFHDGYFMLTHENDREGVFTTEHLFNPANTLKTMKQFAEKSGDIYTEYKNKIARPAFFASQDMDTAFAYLDMFETLGWDHQIDKAKYLDENGIYQEVYKDVPVMMGWARSARDPDMGKKADADYQKILGLFMEVFHHMGRIATEAVAWSQNQIN